MRRNPTPRSTLLALCCAVCLAAGHAGAAQSPDEAAVREVTSKFIAAYGRRDLAGVLALWSERAPDLASVKQTLQRDFTVNDRFELRGLEVNKVTVDADSARVEVTFDLSAVELKTGRPAAGDGFGPGTRALRLVKDDGAWKVWRYAPVEAELADELIAARTDAARAALLAAHPASVNTALVRQLNRRGRGTFTTKTAAESLAVFNLALSLAERLHDRAGLIESWRNVGNVHRMGGNAAPALDAFNKSLSLAEEAGDLEAEGAALNAIAATHFMKGEHDQALVYLRRSIEVARRRGDTDYVIHTLSNIGLVHKSQGKLAEAVADYGESLALAEQAGDRASTVTILTDLGNTHILLSDYPQARAAYERGLQIARQLGDRRGTGGALVSLGILAKTLGDYDQALDYFQQGLQLAEETGDKSLIATALGNLGSLYHVRGDFARALAAYQRSLRLREESKHAPGIAVMLTNIGLIYKAQGNYALALDYLQRGLTVKREINDRPSISSSLSHLGSLYADQRDYARALDYLRQSLALSEGLGDRSGIAHTLSHIGLTYYEQGDYKTALDHWQRSLAIRETIGERAGVANAWAKIADAYLKLGQPAEAADYAGRAAAVARQIGQPELLMNARTSAGLAQEALGQPAAARESLLGAVAAAESLRLLAAGDEQEQGRSFESLVAPYNALIGLSVRQRDPVQALLYADRAKGRVLLDVLRDGRVNITKAMTPDEVRQERALAAAMAAPNAQLARLRQQPDPDAAQVSALSARLDQARLAYQAFQTGLYAEHPQLQTQRGHASPLTSADAAALLPDAASALLEYAVTEDETYLFVVTRGGDGASPDVRAYPLGVKGAELSELAASFRRRVAERDLTIKQPAEQLYNLLVRPAARQLQGVTRLRIVPDGPLWELPFQALHAGPRGYLIEQYAVSYAPSLAVLREMRRRRDGRATPPHAPPTVRRGAGLLALGNPSLGGTAAAGVEGARDEPLSPLPSAEREVNVLGQLYGRGQSRVLVGPEARESAVKREAGNYRVLHFATHALLDDHNPMYSRIMLASEAESSSEDGLLEAWEVMRLDLSAELVVLSSCQTARGRVAAGEGTIGISWALFVAGCPAEVVSQWQVDSARTTELMIEFHRNLVGAPSAGRRSPTKAEALQRAALKMLRGPYSHPAYWAAFVLIGDER